MHSTGIPDWQLTKLHNFKISSNISSRLTTDRVRLTMEATPPPTTTSGRTHFSPTWRKWRAATGYPSLRSSFSKTVLSTEVSAISVDKNI